MMQRRQWIQWAGASTLAAYGAGSAQAQSALL